MHCEFFPIQVLPVFKRWRLLSLLTIIFFLKNRLLNDQNLYLLYMFAFFVMSTICCRLEVLVVLFVTSLSRVVQDGNSSYVSYIAVASFYIQYLTSFVEDVSLFLYFLYWLCRKSQEYKVKKENADDLSMSCYVWYLVEKLHY